VSELDGLHVVTIRALVKPGVRVDVQALYDATPAFFAEHGVTIEWREAMRQAPDEFDGAR
jgi:hypothetical protein